MLIIYWKSDGEIHQVCPNYKTLEEFYGKRAAEYSLLFDAIYIEEVDYFIFNNFYQLEVKDKQLQFKNKSILRNIK